MKREIAHVGVLCVFAFACTSAAFAERRIPLEDFDLKGMTCGHGTVQTNKSCEGKTLTIGTTQYAHGIGTHAPSSLEIPLGGKGIAFSVTVGVDREVVAPGSITLKVIGDGREIAATRVLTRDTPAQTLTGSLKSLRLVEFVVTDGGDDKNCDHADIVDSFLTVTDDYKAPAPDELTSQFGILTPPVSPKPRVNGARILGVRPNHPVLFRVPVTGKDVKVRVRGLERAKGLVFDSATRILSGAIAAPGDYRLSFVAENALGRDEKPFTVRVGEKIALTPPMGFNSWNYVGDHPSDAMMRKAADAMIERGLADHGYQYVNVDDCWQQRNIAKCKWRWKNGKRPENPPVVIERDATGRVIPQKAFPDMKALADYIHAKGLKCGLYSSPGNYTCGGSTGSWKHEYQDAATWAEWGFDYVKYDLCSYWFSNMAYGPSTRMRAMIPYLLMGKALKEQPRDIVLSICQYGLDDVSVWGERAYGQCWRTTGDVFDNWGKVSGAIARQRDNWYYSGPGAWNDPDMLVVKSTVKTTQLTPNEQYTHISMWAMVASPLMIGCDMSALDDFTLALLSNDEVIEIDQDVLGKGAALIDVKGKAEVWGRPLADGSVALAFFNTSEIERAFEFDLKDLGLEGDWAFRDVWRQTDMGAFSGRWQKVIPGHATILVRARPAGGSFRKGLDDIRDLSWLRFVNARH